MQSTLERLPAGSGRLLLSSWLQGSCCCVLWRSFPSSPCVFKASWRRASLMCADCCRELQVRCSHNSYKTVLIFNTASKGLEPILVFGQMLKSVWWMESFRKAHTFMGSNFLKAKSDIHTLAMIDQIWRRESKLGLSYFSHQWYKEHISHI